MDNSWIKLYRKILDNDALFRSANTFTLWCWILLMVNRKSGTIKTGRHSIARWLKIKPTTVYQTLKRLEKMEMIELKSDNKMTTITVVNWSSYQANLSSENIEKNQIRQQNDTIQEYKNKEEEKSVVAETEQSLSGEGCREGSSLPRNSRTQEQTGSNQGNLDQLKVFLKVDDESVRQKTEEDWLKQSARAVGMSVEAFKKSIS